MKTAINNLSELPAETIDLVSLGAVTYRGCGMGKNANNTKIRVNGKEYMITSELFNKLGGIDKMKFYAPFRK
jgi:hypothetical protein